MKKVIAVVAVAGFLLVTNTALADGQNHSGGHSGSSHVSTEKKSMDVSNSINSTDSHAEGPQSHNMTGEGHENMDMDMGSTSEGHVGEEHGTEGESQGHGHGEVPETPPNVTVLSIFGGINLAFLLFGAWNKWVRKKEDALV